MSIQTTIAAAATSLPPSLARIARAVAEQPAIVVDSTISELAAACDTSVASVVRFCRAVGVDGYAALRMSLAAELARESVQFGAGGYGAEIAASDSLRQATAKIAALELLAIEETVGGLDDATLADAVPAIADAERVTLFGIGASGLVAADFAQKLLRIGHNALSPSDPHVAGSIAALGTPATVAVGFSHTGTTSETVRFLQSARQAGSRTIAVTGAAGSPASDAADLTLLTYAREPRLRAGAMVSRIAQLVVVDCLFVGVLQRRRDDAVDALRRTADATRALHDEPRKPFA